MRKIRVGWLCSGGLEKVLEAGSLEMFVDVMLPIWKKETFVDGLIWAPGEPFPMKLVTNSHTGGAEA